MILRNQKITIGEMRVSGVHGVIVYCADYKCSHWIRISADQWPAAQLYFFELPPGAAAS